MFTPHIKQPIRSNPTLNPNHISGAVPLRSISIDLPVLSERMISDLIRKLAKIGKSSVSVWLR